MLYHGRKETEKIVAEIRDGQNYYNISLIESDGRLIIEHERLGFCNRGGWSDSIEIANFKEESEIKNYNGAKRGDYIKAYLSQIRKFHFHDTGRRSPFTAECDVVNDSYVMYEHGENISAILYKMRGKNPMAYNRYDLWSFRLVGRNYKVYFSCCIVPPTLIASCNYNRRA